MQTLEEYKSAVVDRVLFGNDHGGFVEHVANRNWEQAIFACSNPAVFVDLMKWRLWHLPNTPAPYNGPPIAGAAAMLIAIQKADKSQAVG